jgi:hypothetical protein
MKLQGIKVVDLSWFLPGPYLTTSLADHGAEVIKVEPPGEGDPGRHILPPDQRTSVFFRNMGRGKKSVVLDLKSEPGRADLFRLACEADVLVESFRPGVAARFGIGYAPEGWQGLREVMADYADPLLVEVGLVIVNEDKRYDRFRDRVMFPIRNERGQVVAFGGRVLVSDPAVGESTIRGMGAEPATLDRLLVESDLVTLHCPSLPQTRGLIGTANLARMKAGVLIVNLSRGDLVDPAALVAALDSGHVAGAALDVFAPEPIPAGHGILGRANVILAPHIASVSPAAVKRLRSGAAELAVMAIRGEPLPSVVNGVGAGARG